jgi:hypothetical protein
VVFCAATALVVGGATFEDPEAVVGNGGKRPADGGERLTRAQTPKGGAAAPFGRLARRPVGRPAFDLNATATTLE